MSVLILFALGLMHGVQPDHAIAAASSASRSGQSVWRAALHVASGHAGALVLVALMRPLLPAHVLASMERWAGPAGGASLVLAGAVVIAQVLRNRYLVHAHPHSHDGNTHEHLHAHPSGHLLRHAHHGGRGALMLGLVLGLSGARTALLLPTLAGSDAVIAGIALYCVGVAAGAVGVSALLDLAKRLVRGPGGLRWLDLATGSAAVAVGMRLFATSLP